MELLSWWSQQQFSPCFLWEQGFISQIHKCLQFVLLAPNGLISPNYIWWLLSIKLQTDSGDAATTTETDCLYALPIIADSFYTVYTLFLSLSCNKCQDVSEDKSGSLDLV